MKNLIIFLTLFSALNAYSISLPDSCQRLFTSETPFSKAFARDLNDLLKDNPSPETQLDIAKEASTLILGGYGLSILNNLLKRAPSSPELQLAVAKSVSAILLDGVEEPTSRDGKAGFSILNKLSDMSPSPAVQTAIARSIGQVVAFATPKSKPVSWFGKNMFFLLNKLLDQNPSAETLNEIIKSLTKVLEIAKPEFVNLREKTMDPLIKKTLFQAALPEIYPQIEEAAGQLLIQLLKIQTSPEIQEEMVKFAGAAMDLKPASDILPLLNEMLSLPKNQTKQQEISLRNNLPEFNSTPQLAKQN